MAEVFNAPQIVCKNCNEPVDEETLLGPTSIEEDGPFCKACKAHPKPPESTINCAGCLGELKENDSACKALDQYWHTECFKCDGPCGKPFHGAPFYEHAGRALCPIDFELFAEKCAGCLKPILKDEMAGNGRYWHRACFKCAKCQKPFENFECFHVNSNGATICEKCLGVPAPQIPANVEIQEIGVNKNNYKDHVDDHVNDHVNDPVDNTARHQEQ